MVKWRQADLESLKQSFSDTRSDICNKSLITASYLAIPVLAIDLYRSVTIGWQPVLYLHILAAFILWIITGLRRHIPYMLRASIPIIMLIILGLTGLWGFGLTAAAFPLLVMAPILTVIFLDARLSYYSLAIIIPATIIIGLITVLGPRLPPFDIAQYVTSWQAWGLAVSVLILTGGSVTFGLDWITRYLITASQASTRQARLLQTIVEGTSSSTGKDFFHQLTRSLSESLGTEYAFIGELAPGSTTRIRSIYVWARGEPGQSIEYDLAGTPCDKVIGQGACCIPDNVQALFPDDPMLQEMDADSYAGVRLIGSDGKPLGLLAALGSRPMLNTDLVNMALTVFSTRACAELERLQMKDRIRQHEQRLTFAINAIDSGFSLYDSDDRLVMCNDTYRDSVSESGMNIQTGMSFEDILRQGLDLNIYPEAEGRHEQWLAERVLKRKQCCPAVEQPLSGGRWERLSEYSTSNGERVRIFSNITEHKQAEQTLKASEEKYRGIFDESVVSIFVCDNNKTILDCNQAGLELLGYARNELIGMNMFDVVIDLEAEKLTHQQMLNSGRILNYEHQLIRKDGRVITVLNNSRPLTDAEGNVCGNQSTLLDITDRKTAEKELHENNQILREAQRIGHLGNWTWDVETNDVIWSDEIYRIFGVKQDDFAPSYGSFLSCIHPDDRDHVNESVSQALKGVPYNSIHRILLPDGNISYVHDRGEVFHAPSGQPLRMTGTVQDITEQKEAEQALRKSEQEFRTILNNTSDMITVLSGAGDIIFQSRSSSEILGYRPEELVGRNYLEFIHPDDTAEIQEMIADLDKRPGGDAQAEFKFRHKDGSWINLSSQGKNTPLDTVFQGIIVNIRDVTGQRMMEQAIQRSEDMLTAAIETINEGFVVFDADDRFVSCNSRYREIYPEVADLLVAGNQRQDILRISAERGLFPDADGRVADWVAERLEQHRSGSHHIEQRLASGKWLKSSTGRMPDGSSVGVRVDITELKQAEEAARLAQIRFQDYAETASDWLWETGPDFCFTYISKIRGIIGRQISDFIGHNRIDWIRKHNEPAVTAKYDSYLQQLKPFKDFEYQFKSPNGDLCFTQISGRPLFDATGEFLGYRGTGRDSTEPKQVEFKQAQTQKMEALGRLAGGIAHDFNNTLQPISLLSSAIKRGMRTDDPIYPNISIINDAVTQLSSLTRRITQFSRQGNMEKHLTDICAIIREAIILSSIALPDNISIHDELDEDAGHILANAAELQSVVLNLITNAVDACDGIGGNIRICLSKTAPEPDGDDDTEPTARIRLTITDNGAGISDENLPYIFEPLFSTKTSGKGIGLGLSSVYGIVTVNHGGRVEVKSQLGQGSVFEIFLPISGRKKIKHNGLQQP